MTPEREKSLIFLTSKYFRNFNLLHVGTFNVTSSIMEIFKCRFLYFVFMGLDEITGPLSSFFIAPSVGYCLTLKLFKASVRVVILGYKPSSVLHLKFLLLPVYYRDSQIIPL